MWTFVVCVLIVGGAITVSAFRTVMELLMLEADWKLETIAHFSQLYGKSNKPFYLLEFTTEFRQFCAKHEMIKFIDATNEDCEQFYGFCRSKWHVDYPRGALMYPELLVDPGLYPLPKTLRM